MQLNESYKINTDSVRLSAYLTVEKLKLVISAKLEESGDPTTNRGTRENGKKTELGNMKRKKSFHDFKTSTFNVLKPWQDCTSPSPASSTPQEEPSLRCGGATGSRDQRGRQRLRKLRQSEELPANRASEETTQGTGGLRY